MTTDGERLGEVIELMRATDFSKPMFNSVVHSPRDNERITMTTEQLPPCKECGMMPLVSPYSYSLPVHGNAINKKSEECLHFKYRQSMPTELWRLIHTPDPRIAELTAQVHELEKLLEESHVVAAALDTELRVLKAKQPIWDTIAQAADAIPESALADVPTDGASNHDKYLYSQGESKAIFDHVAETKPEEL